MDIEFLREIGRSFFKEVSRIKPQRDGNSLGRGASGDMTYPIDKMAEEWVISAFEREGIRVNLIAEESGTTKVENSEISLIIDPIDGSKNAISGIPFFSTSIAIADGKTLESLKFGYIINLINGDEFWAERGKGAFMNEQQIRTNHSEKPIIVAFEASNPYDDLKGILPLFKIASRVRCFGSTALDLAYLSMGALNAFVTPTPSRIFDFSAGVLIAEEAGAVVTDIYGKSIKELEIKFNTRTTLLVSATQVLHKRALSQIQ